MKNNKILIAIIIVLLILNVVSLSFIWKRVNRGEHRPPKVERYLGKRLNLNEEQIDGFKMARKQHFEESSKLQKSISEIRLALAKENDSNKADSLLDLIVSKNVELERLNHEHFRKLKSICNEQQKVKFDSLFFDLIRKGNMHRGQH